ncbi:MAG: DUF4255 domain-containing protein [Candidatus Solibacter sp.]
MAQIVRDAAQSAIPGSDVLTERPDTVALTQPRVRLFLYQVTPNPALRNNDLPTRTATGEARQRPTVAIDLRYMLAFYGNEALLEPQLMLGAVVRDLHAKPVLTPDMIANAIASQPFLTNSNLADSIEQVKIVAHPMDLEELSKLWSVLYQTPYTLTLGYQASVILIESTDPASPALPVLRRGELDRGVETLLGAFPLLDSIHIGEIADPVARLRLPSYPNARMGAILTVRGRNLGGDTVTLTFRHANLLAPIVVTIPPADRTATQVITAIPTGPAADVAWPAGLYQVELALTTASGVRTSNRINFSLAPQITGIAPASPIAGAGTDVTLTVSCSPQVLPGQLVSALFAGRDIPAEPHPLPVGSVDFVVRLAPVAGPELLRLRVEGVDCLPFIIAGTPPLPELDNSQKVQIT